MTDSFNSRHIGPGSEEIRQMLEFLGYPSLDALIDAAVPRQIRTPSVPEFPPLSEAEALSQLRMLASQNHVFRSYIGMGYYDCVTPPVLVRNILENPGWYTPYTPYQAEISQGRLEALLNFQTMIIDLTGLEVANASLLDEATAAAEAMTMSRAIKADEQARTFFVSDNCHPQTVAVVRTRAKPLGIDVVVDDPDSFDFKKTPGVFGALLQYPATDGEICDYRAFCERAHGAGALVTVAADILALALLTPPGEFGADIAVGSTQRFGVPLGYGGPHAAYFATKDAYKRQMPGRIVGVSKDSRGRPALRLALQTREQHIRREKATSNICTAQVLLAVLSSMYAVYHGPDGIQEIAGRVHRLTQALAEGLKRLGCRVGDGPFFDTIRVEFAQAHEKEKSTDTLKGIFAAAKARRINLRAIDPKTIGISLDETATESDVADLLQIFTLARTPSPPPSPSRGRGKHVVAPRPQGDLAKRSTTSRTGRAYRAQYRGQGSASSSLGMVPAAHIGGREGRVREEVSVNMVQGLLQEAVTEFPAPFKRTSPFLTHSVFRLYHSETEMMRYLRRLQAKDISLADSMIPLGSCTMKLNAAAEMLPITWPEFARIHPFAPVEQTQGYQTLFRQLEDRLKELTGFDGVSLMPNAGSQGEYTGLLTIRAYHEKRGESRRDVCLIPQSAHGTNPASAVMAGLRVVVVACDAHGNIDLADLKAKAQEYRERLAALMVTYPSTHGVFEETILEISRIVHDCCGQVYMDGANLNALVGLANPGDLGADVCHFNLHKTFCIPHGGGGPGMGPIGVKKHLTPFLSGHPVISTGGPQGIGPVSAAPWGSAGILPISWAYIAMMGSRGLAEATKVAILNANYAAKKLEPHYPVLYKGKKGLVAHECILDLRALKDCADVQVEDVAKRLMDYGFHAPTVSWPVPGTMMVEPTESESKTELDRFCEAMISIRGEIREIETGKAGRRDNVLKNAPHTADMIASDRWTHPYSRERAAYPAPWSLERKFWPAVGRIDSAYGDRNFVCSCLPVESYLNL